MVVVEVEVAEEIKLSVRNVPRGLRSGVILHTSRNAIQPIPMADMDADNVLPTTLSGDVNT
jgi:hypothetical protein